MGPQQEGDIRWDLVSLELLIPWETPKEFRECGLTVIFKKRGKGVNLSENLLANEWINEKQ